MITPELAYVIKAALEDRLLDVHTALPGAVQSYDPLTQTADIQLLVRRPVEKASGGYITEELPILPNVPVQFMRGGGQFLSMPLEVGDTGLVIFNEASIDQWRNLDDVASPGEIGRHTLSSGVFFPGLASNLKPVLADIGSDAVFGKESGAQFRSKGTTMEVTTGGAPVATDFVAMAAKVDYFIQNFHALMLAWIPVPNDGGAKLQADYIAKFVTPGPTAPPQPCGSTNLKAD